jgi:hypothetical protein
MAAEPLCCKADLGKRASARASSRRLAVPDLKALMRVGMFNPNYMHLERLSE